MSELRFVSQGVFSNDFDVFREDEQKIGVLQINGWRNHGNFIAGIASFYIEKKGFWNPVYTAISELSQEGTVLASAQKEGIFSGTIRVMSQNELFLLQTRSGWVNTMEVLKGGFGPVGSIKADGIFTRKGSVNLTVDLPVELKLFFLWLTLRKWSEDAASAA